MKCYWLNCDTHCCRSRGSMVLSFWRSGSFGWPGPRSGISRFLEIPVPIPVSVSGTFTPGGEGTVIEGERLERRGQKGNGDKGTGGNELSSTLVNDGLPLIHDIRAIYTWRKWDRECKTKQRNEFERVSFTCRIARTSYEVYENKVGESCY